MSVGGSDVKTPGQERVVRDAGGAVDGKCPLCRTAFKDHPDLGTWGAEMLKLDGRDLACTTYESAVLNCVGQATPWVRLWYSRDVPGHVVKMTSAQCSMSVVKYEAKPRK